MDQYFNDYLNFRMDTDMTDNNRRINDQEIDSYYQDYLDRYPWAKGTRSDSNRHPEREGHTTWEAPEPPTEDPDMVNNPDHYTHNGIEAIDVIEAKLTDEQFQGYLQGSVMKYLLRSNYKGKRNEDLNKAQWYLNCLVDGTDDSFE